MFDPRVSYSRAHKLVENDWKKLAEFWNKGYALSDDYKHCYDPNTLRVLIEANSIIYRMRDQDDGSLMATIVGHFTDFSPRAGLADGFVPSCAVDFLCVRGDLRKAGLAANMIDTLDYISEKVYGVNVFIFLREIKPCPFPPWGSLVYKSISLGGGLPSAARSAPPTVSAPKAPSRHGVEELPLGGSKGEIPKRGGPGGGPPPVEFVPKQYKNLAKVFQLVVSQCKQTPEVVFKHFSDFWKWIICPLRHIIVDKGGYCAILEDCRTIDKHGGLSAEVVWSNGIPCTVPEDWKALLRETGFQTIIFGTNLKKPVTESLEISWAGFAFVYMHNWSYTPMCLTFNI
jgi:hypothetical protein